jgi:hypothetical protein
MQNQGIAQVERKGRAELGFDVIRAAYCQDWKSGLRPRALDRAQSPSFGGYPGTFRALGGRLDRPAGDAEAVSY